MPFTFGSDIFSKVTYVGSTSNNVAGVFTAGWWYPTTLTAGKWMWTGSNLEFGPSTTTTTLAVNESHGSAYKKWEIADVLATNTWVFLAVLNSPINAGGAIRVWKGSLQEGPVELTPTLIQSPTGNLFSAGTGIIGNRTSQAFQGHIHNIYDVSAWRNGLGFAPEFGDAGTISDAEAEWTRHKIVIPAYLGTLNIHDLLMGSHSQMLNVPLAHLTGSGSSWFTHQSAWGRWSAGYSLTPGGAFGTIETVSVTTNLPSRPAFAHSGNIWFPPMRRR